MEEINHLQQSIENVIKNRNPIPDEVMTIIETGFTQLQNIYEQFDCNSDSITTYMEGVLDEVKSYIIHTIGEEHRDEQLKEADYVLSQIKKDMDNLEFEQNREQKYQVLQIGNDGYSAVQGIIMQLEEGLKDIHSTQRRNMDNQGIDMNSIDEIDYAFLGFISKYLSSSEEEMTEIMNTDNQQLQNELIKQYELFLGDTKQTETEKFKTRLDANIGLEEQNRFSQTQKDKLNFNAKMMADEKQDAKEME